MPTLMIEPEKIYELVDQLDYESKVKIFEHLKPQILQDRWDGLFVRIDKRKETFPINDNEIKDEIEHAREENLTNCG